MLLNKLKSLELKLKTELKNRFTNGIVSPAPIEIKIKGDIALKIIDQS